MVFGLLGIEIFKYAKAVPVTIFGFFVVPEVCNTSAMSFLALCCSTSEMRCSKFTGLCWWSRRLNSPAVLECSCISNTWTFCSVATLICLESATNTGTQSGSLNHKICWFLWEVQSPKYSKMRFGFVILPLPPAKSPCCLLHPSPPLCDMANLGIRIRSRALWMQGSTVRRRNEGGRPRSKQRPSELSGILWNSGDGTLEPWTLNSFDRVTECLTSFDNVYHQLEDSTLAAFFKEKVLIWCDKKRASGPLGNIVQTRSCKPMPKRLSQTSLSCQKRKTVPLDYLQYSAQGSLAKAWSSRNVSGWRLPISLMNGSDVCGITSSQVLNDLCTSSDVWTLATEPIWTICIKDYKGRGSCERICVILDFAASYTHFLEWSFGLRGVCTPLVIHSVACKYSKKIKWYHIALMHYINCYRMMQRWCRISSAVSLTSRHAKSMEIMQTCNWIMLRVVLTKPLWWRQSVHFS